MIGLGSDKNHLSLNTNTVVDCNSLFVFKDWKLLRHNSSEVPNSLFPFNVSHDSWFCFHMLSLSTVSKIRTWELLNFSKLILTHVHDFKTTLTDILPIFSTQNDFCFTITPFWEIHITQNWFLVPGLMETDVKKRIFPNMSPSLWTGHLIVITMGISGKNEIWS